MKAFPSRESIYGSDVIGVKENSGMDLRDYFAAKAMQSLINEKYWHDPKGGIHQINIAEDCYAMADAMMKAREK
jgi:hypothetical protein